MSESGFVAFDGWQVFYKQSSNQENPSTRLFIKDRWETTVDGAAVVIESNYLFTVVYTSKHLVYVIWTESGRRAIIPLKFEPLSRVFLNKTSHLLVLETNGRLKVIDLSTSKLRHKSDIRGLLINHYLGPKSKKLGENNDWFKDYQSDFQVYLTSSGDPVLKLDITNFLIYNSDYECWAAAPEDIVTKSFNLEDDNLMTRSKPFYRNLLFEAHQEEMLASELSKNTALLKAPELSEFLANRDEVGHNSNVISKIEEEMLFCIEKNDKTNYNECLKNYILELAGQKQYEKLKYFLIVTLLTENQGKERQFLNKIGVKPETILTNSLKILEKIGYCKNVAEEIRQAAEIHRLDR